MNEDPYETALLELLLQGRPERIVSTYLAGSPDVAKQAAGRVSDALTALALADAPVAPSAGLKARLMASLAKQTKRSAFLVMDMLNDHLNPGGPVEIPRARDIVPALAKRLDAARAAGMPVVYVVDRHEPEDADFEEWLSHNVVGTPGAEIWPALAPKPGDVQVPKSTYSAFVGSDLAKVLDDLAVDTLVLTGCVTEIGIMATACDALQRGYAIEIPPDAQAGMAAEGEMATLATLSVMGPHGPARRERLKRVQEKRAELGAR